MTSKTPRLLVAVLFLAMSSSVVLNAQTAVTVNARRLQLDTDTMWITRVAEGHEIPSGSAISTLHAASSGDLVLRYSYQITDKAPVTTITELDGATLRPTQEVHDYGTGDTLVVHYGPQGRTRNYAVADRLNGMHRILRLAERSVLPPLT